MLELPMVGDEFAGYRLRSVLGRGGMSAVYQAENPRLGNVIALKILAPELADDDLFRTRFLEESRIAASMNHPNVIPIHDMGSSGGLLYIAMRCVTGTDLRQMIAKRGRLQPEMAVLLLTQAARALDAAHRRGLVHRDVKPGNLLIEWDGEEGEPDHLYLADFGITKPVMSRSGLSSSGQFLGTLDYVAPEQIRGMPVLGTADQYSLGCVLYECLTGRVPFEKDLDAAVIWAHVEERPARPTSLRPDLPPAVDEVFARVLAKEPGDRYESCREFMVAARAALGGTAATPAAGGMARAGTPRGPRILSAPVGYRASGEYPVPAEYPGPVDYPEPGGYPGPADYPEPGGYPGAADYPEPGGYPGAADYPEPAGYPEAEEYPRFAEYPGAVDYPAELTHETADEPPTAPAAGAGVGAAGPPTGGFDGFDGWPPRRQPRRGLLRARWLVVAAAAMLLAAGIGTWRALSPGSSAQPRAMSASSMKPAQPMGSMGSAPSPAGASETGSGAASPSGTGAAAQQSSALMRALTLANESDPATGKLPPATCKQQGATMATCTAPAPGVTAATFKIYPSLTALYSAYETLARSLNSGHFQQNVQDCGLAAPSPVGEVAWNHDFKHPKVYSVQQMEMGMVPLDKAAGRMFCVFLDTGTEDIVWTQDNGNLLGVVSGGPHADVWYWWSAVHHSIALDGKPMQMPMPSMPS